MIWFVQSISAIILIFPIVVLFMTYAILRKMKMKTSIAFGFAADITTAILFISVPLAIQSIWNISLFYVIFMLALLIALFFTYIDWRTKKEIEVPFLLKKIWRIYFISLSTLYFLTWIIGVTKYILDYTASVS